MATRRSDFSTPKGSSFGLLAQKNEKDRNRKEDINNDFEESPEIEARRPKRALFEKKPDAFSNRKSHDFKISSSFRELANRRENNHKPSESQNFNNMGKTTKERLKIVPLQERRSQTRRLRANTLTRCEIITNIKSSNPKEEIIKKPEIKIKNLAQVVIPVESLKIDEDEQLSTYSLFTKIISGALERLGGNEQLQLA